MSEITTTIPRKELHTLVAYSWAAEVADYASTHDIDPEVAMSHAHANPDSGHIFNALVKVALWLEATEPESADNAHGVGVNADLGAT